MVVFPAESQGSGLGLGLGLGARHACSTRLSTLPIGGVARGGAGWGGRSLAQGEVGQPNGTPDDLEQPNGTAAAAAAALTWGG